MRLLRGFEVEIDGQVPRKYHVASDAEEHGASTRVEMGNVGWILLACGKKSAAKDFVANVTPEPAAGFRAALHSR